jgi:hypothetical protein
VLRFNSVATSAQSISARSAGVVLLGLAYTPMIAPLGYPGNASWAIARSARLHAGQLGAPPGSWTEKFPIGTAAELPRCRTEIVAPSTNTTYVVVAPAQ